jgi:hypothetical protein
VILGTTQSLDPLASLGATLIDRFRDGCRSDEAHRVNNRVFKEAPHRIGVTVNNGEDPSGKSSFGKELGDEERGGGIFLRWFQNEGVAAGKCIGGHPEWDHYGKVERRNTVNDADGLTQGVNVNAGRYLRGEGSLKVCPEATGVLNIFEASANFAQRVSVNFAVLSGDDGGEVVATSVEEVAEAKEHFSSSRHRRLSPGLASGARRSERERDLFARGNG